MMNSKKILGDKRPEGTTPYHLECSHDFRYLYGYHRLLTPAVSHKAAFGVPVGMIGMGFLVLLAVVGTVSFFIKERQEES